MLVLGRPPAPPPDTATSCRCFSQEEASIADDNFSCRLHHQRSGRVVLPLQVKRTYSQGTYRAGAMRQVSLVGAVDEEVGDYFPEFISMLEESPFLEVSGSRCSACVCVRLCTCNRRHGRRRCERAPCAWVGDVTWSSVLLQRTLPWGTFSSLRLQSPTESDDGPIMWVRPGEQMIPMADMPKSPFKRKRCVEQLMQ